MEFKGKVVHNEPYEEPGTRPFKKRNPHVIGRDCEFGQIVRSGPVADGRLFHHGIQEAANAMAYRDANYNTNTGGALTEMEKDVLQTCGNGFLDCDKFDEKRDVTQNIAYGLDNAAIPWKLRRDVDDVIDEADVDGWPIYQSTGIPHSPNEASLKPSAYTYCYYSL